MKPIQLTIIALVLSLFTTTLRAEGPPAMKCEMCETCEMCQMMKKKAAAQESALVSGELDKLVVEMNGSIGARKIEAMAAVVTRLVEQYKTSQATKAADSKPANEAHQH